MEYRKLIGFGKSSHVISLPKKWLVKNNLKKGDQMSLLITENTLLIKPVKTVSNEKQIIIEGHTNLEITKKRLLNAYINNADIIIINNPSKEIKELVKNFIAIEITGDSKKRLVAKSFLDLEKVNYQNLIRKIDYIITEMFSETNLVKLKKLDKEVNKLSFLIFRAIKFSNDSELIRYWCCTHFLEEIGDLLKTINVDLLEERNIYKKAMKAFYKNDFELICKIQEEINGIKNKELSYLIKNLNLS